MAQAQSDADKNAVIDAEKDALIEVKKQVAQDGEIEPTRATLEPMKMSKRQQRRAERLAKKQAENAVPVPHNKRGKISEKTLDSGTVK